MIQTEEPTRESAPHLDLSDRALIGDHLGVDGFPAPVLLSQTEKQDVSREWCPQKRDSMAFVIQSKSLSVWVSQNSDPPI